MNKPASELIARLETSQRACFDAGLHVAAMDIQSARAEIARTAAAKSGSERAGVDALREALEFGIWAVSGPTNEAEVERLEQIIEETWREYQAKATPPAQPAPAATHGKPDGAVREAVLFVLHNDERERDYPIYETNDDRGLEEYEYINFATDVIAALHSPKIAAAETSPGTAPQITMADIRARVGDGMVSSDDVIEAANTLLRKHWEAETGPGDNYSKEIERQIMEVADMIAATLDQPSDPRAWDHLLVYAPRDALERRLSTLNPGEYDDTVLALNRTDDEVRQRHVDRGGFEPGNSDQVENEPSRNAPLRMEVSNCGTQGVIAAIDRLDVKAEAKSQEPDAMAIKPLEWSDNEGDGVQVADAVTGEYRVRCHGGEFWVVARDGIPLSSRPYELASFAKAAAQADYEQRIRSTLIHPMTKPEAPASTSSLSRG